MIAETIKTSTATITTKVSSAPTTARRSPIPPRPGAVLRYRVERATARPAGSGRARKTARLIVGLIPHADGPMAADMRRALDERRALIEARADAVLDIALSDAEGWTKALGTPPTDPHRSAAWRRSARTVAAYRDRYQITDNAPLGTPPASTAQKIDATRARAALDRTKSLANAAQQTEERVLPSTPERVGPVL